jgi:hypothetical protein
MGGCEYFAHCPMHSNYEDALRRVTYFVVKFQSILNHAHPLSLISYYNKSISNIVVIVTFHSNRFVSVENHAHVDRTQNNLTTNVLSWSTIDHCRSRCKGREGPPLIHSFIQRL